jgi:hypothetical protein
MSNDSTRWVRDNRFVNLQIFGRCTCKLVSDNANRWEKKIYQGGIKYGNG